MATQQPKPPPRTSFGQVVVGPPGSGKTTYCVAMVSLLKRLGRRAVVINLDPANDKTAYGAAASIGDLITVDQAMQSTNLGPNGALVHCMEFLAANLDWLDEVIAAQWRAADSEVVVGGGKRRTGPYFLFDCPGQVELYTHHKSFREVVEHLQKMHDMRLTAVHLVDSVNCTQPHTFVSALVVSLTTMIHLSMPHVNVLTKVDMIKQYGKLPFDMDFFTEGLDTGLHHLAECVESSSAFGSRFKALTSSLCDLVSDFGLVGFTTLTVTDKGESALELLSVVDKANGYSFFSMDLEPDLTRSLFSLSSADPSSAPDLDDQDD